MLTMLSRIARCLRTGPIMLALVLALSAGQAQVVIAPPPTIGSSNTVSPEPTVPRPSTKPCVVKLFTNEAFADYHPKTFSYAPPEECPGPWAKVIFTADFTMSGGVQYSRTVALYIGHANMFYGTTPDSTATLSPSWHVERDVTDLSALFSSNQEVEADTNIVLGASFPGIIYANAALEFYPPSSKSLAATAPDLVVGVPDSAGGAGELDNFHDLLSQKLTLPTNVVRAYLDVIAQGSFYDRVWYACLPGEIYTPTGSCVQSAFRETEISIDGSPAGVAPTYPWLDDGGVGLYDFFSLYPLPGVQTLNFRPYRVDLTPFAGLLDDGATHTLGLSIFNNGSYWFVTANLLIFTDHGKDVVDGKLVSNTLSAAPKPIVVEDITLDDSNYGKGTISVTSNRSFTISGYVNTSQGKVTTTVAQQVNFLNEQSLDFSAVETVQDITQSTSVNSTTTTEGGGKTAIVEANYLYPLTLNTEYQFGANGNVTQTSSVDQQAVAGSGSAIDRGIYSLTNEEVKSTDIMEFNYDTGAESHHGMKSSATYLELGGPGDFYYLGLGAKDNVLTSISHSM